MRNFGELLLFVVGVHLTTIENKCAAFLFSFKTTTLTTKPTAVIQSQPPLQKGQQHLRILQQLRKRPLYAADNDDGSGKADASEAEKLKRKAEELREQIRKMEEKLGPSRPRNHDTSAAAAEPPSDEVEETEDGVTKLSLNNKRVLVAGANGRLGSMVCRYLLRNHPKCQVVAAVHYVGENSSTARGYGRLSYEVGAEDGVGSIGAAWSAEDRTATFEYDPTFMQEYNLQNLRLVECELLDPVQCMSVVDDAERIDAMIWCATDFNGNQPRSISPGVLNVAFLFRAVIRPDKGRVEIEGLQNMLGALKKQKSQALQTQRLTGSTSKTTKNDPINVVLVSTTPEAYTDFETPFGTFHGIKRQAESMLQQDFPSLTSTVLQLSRFDDNFVGEGLDIQMEEAAAAKSVGDDNSNDSNNNNIPNERRRINRRDAAKAVADALVNPDLIWKTVQVWTATTGR